MEQKIVSFKAAKAIKEAGYPQSSKPIKSYNIKGELEPKGSNYKRGKRYDAPTYLEVWLWLWQEKKITLFNLGNINNEAQIDILIDSVFIHTTDAYADPEEAIIAAIDYLVNNDLIK